MGIVIGKYLRLFRRTKIFFWKTQISKEKCGPPHICHLLCQRHLLVELFNTRTRTLLESFSDGFPFNVNDWPLGTRKMINTTSFFNEKANLIPLSTTRFELEERWEQMAASSSSEINIQFWIVCVPFFGGLVIQKWTKDGVSGPRKSINEKSRLPVLKETFLLIWKKRRKSETCRGRWKLEKKSSW